MEPATQREPQELMRQLMVGQLDRRGFIRRAIALGFSASAVAAFLAACGGTPTATTTTSSSSATSAAATSSSSSSSAAASSAAGGAASSSATTTKAATSSSSSSAASSAANSSATTSAAATASPTSSGGSGLGVKTDKPIAAGGGLGPGPTKRGGGGTLKMLWWQAPTILNPHLAQGTKDFDASRVVYEPLADFGPDDKLVPFLAAEIPSTDNGGVAADGKSVTWKLKPGVKWSDGQPFTAKDVVFTCKYATDKETAAVTTGIYAGIAKVEAVDDTTVKITFKEPTPGWYIRLHRHRTA